MKNIFTHRLLFSFIIMFSVVLLFSQCKKDEECGVVITVKLMGPTAGDTNQLVTSAAIKLWKGDVNEVGTTDANGNYSSKFKLEAILNIDVNRGDTILGNGIVRLKPGATVYKTVFVSHI
ncbi:MAG: hypothetical protein HXX09_00045 [Bacteroidetes bacterium]|nr:hypothetical protein [Bacteroidota bacterium]